MRPPEGLAAAAAAPATAPVPEPDASKPKKRGRQSDRSAGGMAATLAHLRGESGPSAKKQRKLQSKGNIGEDGDMLWVPPSRKAADLS